MLPKTPRWPAMRGAKCCSIFNPPPAHTTVRGQDSVPRKGVLTTGVRLPRLGKRASPLVEMMTGSLGMVMGVPTHGRCVGQPAEELGDLVLGCRPDNEVPMIGHQAVGKDRQPLSDVGLGNHPFKRLPVPEFLSPRVSRTERVGSPLG